MTLYSLSGFEQHLHGENVSEIQVVTVNQQCFGLCSYLVLVVGNSLLLWLFLVNRSLKYLLSQLNASVVWLHNGLYQIHPVSWICSFNFQNMVGAGEVDEDLEVETKEECEKYGKVGKCVIFEVRDNLSLLGCSETKLNTCPSQLACYGAGEGV